MDYGSGFCYFADPSPADCKKYGIHLYLDPADPRKTGCERIQIRNIGFVPKFIQKNIF